MKAVQLGNVVFEYPQEVLRACSVMSEKFKSAAGTSIVYEAKDYNPEMTISSAPDDWLSLENITELQAMCEEMGQSYTLRYEDGSSEEVRFDHTRQMTFSEILLGTCFYYGSIPLEKIN